VALKAVYIIPKHNYSSRNYTTHFLIAALSLGGVEGVEVRIKRDVNFQKEIEVLKEKLVIEQ
jgi:hypothetical protein